MKLKKSNRVLALVVCVCIVCSAVIPRSNALVGSGAVIIGGLSIPPVAIAVGAAALIAGGVVFATNEDARNATLGFFARLSEPARTKWAIIKGIGEIGSELYRLSDDMWADTKSELSSQYAVGENMINPPWSYYHINGQDYRVYGSPYGTTSNAPSDVGVFLTLPNGDTLYLVSEPYQGKYVYFNVYKNGILAWWRVMENTEVPIGLYFYRTSDVLKVRMSYDTVNGYRSASTSESFTHVLGDTYDQSAAGYSAVADPQITDMSRDYLPADKAETHYRAVKIPETFVGATASNVTTTFPIDGVPEVPAVPDGGILDWLTGAWTNTVGGITSTLQGIKTGITSLGGDIAGIYAGVSSWASTMTSSLTATLSDFFTVGNLNYDGLKNLAIFNKFPFSIPFDFVRSIEQFAVSASEPNFRIDIDNDFIQLHHEIDLSPYSLYIGFFRYFVVAAFLWSLVLVTRKVISW